MDCMNCGNRLAPGVKFCPRCGTPAPAANPYGQRSAPTPAGEQMHSSFGGPQSTSASPPRKSRVGKILLIVFAVLLLLGAGAAAAVYFGYKFVEGKIKDSDPYRVAVEELKRNPVAVEQLGEIKETGFPLGDFNESAGGAGHANFTMSVTGTKASGRYDVTMLRQGGVWRVTAAVLRMDGGGVFPLTAVTDPAPPRPVVVPVDEPPPTPPRPAAPGTISGGVLDAKAISKPQPSYPAIAKTARASGRVTVLITVNEQGRVVEARAVGGHPLLQQAAMQAARQARFEPTLHEGKPVRVTGTLTYDFRLE